jgi:hypothetical protein
MIFDHFRAAFLPIFFCHKRSNLNCNVQKTFVQNALLKVLMYRLYENIKGVMFRTATLWVHVQAARAKLIY